MKNCHVENFVDITLYHKISFVAAIDYNFHAEYSTRLSILMCKTLYCLSMIELMLYKFAAKPSSNSQKHTHCVCQGFYEKSQNRENYQTSIPIIAAMISINFNG